MEFFELAKIVEEMKKEKGEECLICQFPISNNEELIKLNCNHHYHIKCLGCKNKKEIICPYCNQLSKIDTKININKCNVILKSGKNIGKKCGRINCKIHNKKKKNILINKCTAIISTGKNKGKVCGRINCKLHKQVNSITNNIVI